MGWYWNKPEGCNIVQYNIGGSDFELNVKCSKCGKEETIVLRVKIDDLTWYVDNQDKYICPICY